MGSDQLTPRNVAPPSKEMRRLLRLMVLSDGQVRRQPGGYWRPIREDEEPCVARAFPSFGTTTVSALVRRGLAYYMEWKRGRHGKFPICASLTREGWSLMGFPAH